MKKDIEVECVHCNKKFSSEDTGYDLFGLCSFCKKAATNYYDSTRYAYRGSD